MKTVSTKQRKAARQPTNVRCIKAIRALGRRPTLEEISESPLLFDAKRYGHWARKRYGKSFMNWVKKNWITASEREIQVMHRAWIAAGGVDD
jgi:hypothetical protein